jgi:hypothetical protein
VQAPNEKREVDVPVKDEDGNETGEYTTVVRTFWLPGTIKFSTKELTERNGSASDEDDESGEEDAA